MWNSPDVVPELTGLLSLRNDLRAKQCTFELRLRELDAELEERHREFVRNRFARETAIGPDLATVELQEEHDEIGLELAHVRLALAETGRDLGRLFARLQRARPAGTQAVA
jgi:hypothetical protein